ncbi:hypothetical protein KR044_000932 [Drosophila immigrans]|nr:hypothetical protein KR044_000932 [Drosophila immigrans]
MSLSDNSISSAPHTTLTSRKLRIREGSKWRQILEQAFPLPDAPPEKCRDEFLAELLKPFESDSDSTDFTDSVISDYSLSSMKVKYGNITHLDGTSFNAEENLLNRMKLNDRRISTSTRGSILSDSNLNVPDLNKLMKRRYGNIASSVGFMAVIIELIKLKNRILIFREMWNVPVTIDNDLRLFGWSIQDYFERFTQPNLVYLDTAELVLGDKIECFKYRMDLKEIMRLYDPIIEDVRRKRDICLCSMLLIKDAETDIEVLLTESQRQATEEHTKAAKAAISAPRSADPFGTRAKAIYTKINHNDFVYPIEARYRINWAQATMEQSILEVGLKEKSLSDEVNKYNKQIEEVDRLWEISSVAYTTQILTLKNDIQMKEIAYEEALDEAENQIQATRIRLNKVKDDLKYYKEQIPMFHRKINEVNEILARQEMVTNTSIIQRKSRKSSKPKLQPKKK